MEVKMKRENQKYINTNKLIEVRIKKDKTQSIMIVIGIFPFFLS